MKKEPGKIAYEGLLEVGDVIINERKNRIYTVMGEEPDPPAGIRKILMVHSSGCGLFRYVVPEGRVENYPFDIGGVWAGW